MTMVARPLALALAFVLPILAGCLGGDEDTVSQTFGPDDPPSSVVVEPEPGVVVAENRAVVRGEVRDDANFPVPGARVSLIGTEFFDDTDKSGWFYMENVTIGEFTLRVEHLRFRAYEEAITTEPGNITTARVNLVPNEERGAGYQTHIHDYWGEKTEHILFDDTVQMCNGLLGECEDETHYLIGATWYSNTNSINARRQIAIPALPDGTPNTVYPGTAEIHVTFRWETTDSTLSKLGFEYAPASSSDIIDMGRHASGEPWIIEVTPEMTDHGHQKYTLWEFFLRPGNNVQAAPDYEPGFTPGEIDVEIILIKADTIPPEPPHEDFWGEEEQLRIHNGTEPIRASGIRFRPIFRLDDGQIVPPGSATMRMTFWWDYSEEPPGVATPLDFDYVLLWRSSEQNPADTEISEFHRAEPIETGDQLRVYEIDLDPAQTDAFYQKKSNWQWWPRVDGFEDENEDADPRAPKLYLEVIVFKDPDFV